MIEAGSCCEEDTSAGEKGRAETGHVMAGVMQRAIVRPLGILVAMLREVFDESAYQRFLERGQLESSANAYALFRRENDRDRSRRPRCC
jgi:hypothetical protein